MKIKNLLLFGVNDSFVFILGLFGREMNSGMAFLQLLQIEKNIFLLKVDI